MSIATLHPSVTVAKQTLHGLVASFDDEEQLLTACRIAYRAGYREMDAYTPVPVEGLAKALGKKPTKIPLIILLGGIVGGSTGYFMQWFSMVYDYPFNIGGRPFHSWPMFIPITFELTVLFAAVSGVLSMLLLNGLPRYHHPIFKAVGIERATLDRFFLCIESTDPRWDLDETRNFLEATLRSHHVVEVPK